MSSPPTNPTPSSPTPSGATTAVALVAGTMLLAFGVWAMVAPQTFHDAVATFPPYNQHLLQDIGAFQIGLSAVLLLATRHGDALTVALAGVGVGSLAHVVSHAVGTHLGGTPAVDLPTFGLLTLALLAAAWRRFTRLRRDRMDV